MSNFVELPIEQYSTTAFNNFDLAAGNFKIANARALMWFSQLAYEGAKGATIEAVRQTWNFASIFSFNIPKIDIVASFDTMGMVGERADAIVLAFAGTDPAVWETLATDFNIRLTPDMDTHIGFQTAADAARPEIIRAITMSKQTGKPLLIAGHSLGAALAALAARFAAALRETTHEQRRDVGNIGFADLAVANSLSRDAALRVAKHVSWGSSTTIPD